MNEEKKLQEKKAIEPIYDRRVTETLAGLLEGKTREEMAGGFGLTNWRSLDTHMRRKGFTWDSANHTYIPAVTSVDTILEELDSGAPFKAEMIIKRFEEMGDDADPRAIAKSFDFSDHRELGEYMESRNLFWDTDKKNYALRVDHSEDLEPEEMANLTATVIQPTDEQKESLKSLEPYLPILNLLLQNRDRLVTLLMPQSGGALPRYAVPGKSVTQT